MQKKKGSGFVNRLLELKDDTLSFFSSSASATGAFFSSATQKSKGFVSKVPFLGKLVSLPFKFLGLVFKPKLAKPMLISYKEIVPYVAKVRHDNARQKSLIVILLIASLSILAFYQGGRMSGMVSGSYIAKIVINEELRDQSVSRDLFKKVLEKVEKDKKVAAVLVEIDSPGGTVYHSHKLFKGIRKIAEQKPTFAIVDSVAASGGYMVATACDKILVSESSLVGSIGVIMAVPNYKNLMDKIGVRYFVYKSSVLKAAPNPFEDTNEEVNREQRSHITSVMNLFRGIVKERRGMTDAEVDLVANGATYYGKEALSKKLIDGITDEDGAVNLLVESGLIPRKMRVVNVSLKPRKQNGYNNPRGSLVSALLAVGRQFGINIQGASEEKAPLKGLLLKYDPEAVATNV